MRAPYTLPSQMGYGAAAARPSVARRKAPLIIFLASLSLELDHARNNIALDT